MCLILHKIEVKTSREAAIRWAWNKHATRVLLTSEWIRSWRKSRKTSCNSCRIVADASPEIYGFARETLGVLGCWCGMSVTKGADIVDELFGGSVDAGRVQEMDADNLSTLSFYRGERPWPLWGPLTFAWMIKENGKGEEPDIKLASFWFPTATHFSKMMGRKLSRSIGSLSLLRKAVLVLVLQPWG